MLRFLIAIFITLPFEILVKLGEASRFFNDLPFIFDYRSATVVGIRVESSAELLEIAIRIRRLDYGFIRSCAWGYRYSRYLARDQSRCRWPSLIANLLMRLHSRFYVLLRAIIVKRGMLREGSGRASTCTHSNSNL